MDKQSLKDLLRSIQYDTACEEETLIRYAALYEQCGAAYKEIFNHQDYSGMPQDLRCAGDKLVYVGSIIQKAFTDKLESCAAAEQFLQEFKRWCDEQEPGFAHSPFERDEYTFDFSRRNIHEGCALIVIRVSSGFVNHAIHNLNICDKFHR